LAVGSWQLAVGSWQLAVGSKNYILLTTTCNRIFLLHLFNLLSAK